MPRTQQSQGTNECPDRRREKLVTVSLCQTVSHSNLLGLHDHHFLSPLAPAQIRQIDLGDISGLHSTAVCELKRNFSPSTKCHLGGYDGIYEERGCQLTIIYLQNIGPDTKSIEHFLNVSQYISL